jgi:hypothetical protein
VEVLEKAQIKAGELLSEQIENSERLKKLEQERAKLKRETLDYFKQWLFWAGINLSRTTPALVIMLVCGLIGGGLGVFVGINALPSAIACPTVRSWCYFLRLNKETTLAPEIQLKGNKDTKITLPKKRKVR